LQPEHIGAHPGSRDPIDLDLKNRKIGRRLKGEKIGSISVDKLYKFY